MKTENLSFEQALTIPRNQVVPYGQYGNTDDDDSEGIDISKILAVLNRRKLLIITIAVIALLASILQAMMTTPIYKATTKLQINEEKNTIIGYNIEIQPTKDYYETQYELLKSSSLARRTINDLGLEDTFQNTKLSKSFLSKKIDNLKELIYGKKDIDFDDKVGEYPAELRFLQNLSVEPLKNSQLVLVSYTHTDPEFSARVVNKLTENYISMSMEKRVDSAAYAKDFLNEQLVLAKSKLQESEEQMIAYANEQEIINTDTTQTFDETLTSRKFQDLHEAVTQAEKERFAAESAFKQSHSGDSALFLSEYVESPVIQQLKQTKAKLQTEYQEKLQIYKPAYPLMVELKNQVKEVDSQLAKEISSFKGGLEAKYLAAKQKEESLKEELGNQKNTLLSSRTNNISFNILKREVEINREIYNNLLQRLKEVNVASGATTSNISVVDPAIIPYKSANDNISNIILKGLLAGIFLGVAAGFIVDYMDDRLRSSADLEKLLGLPLLGITPALKTKDVIEHSMATARQPTSAMAEAFRSLRTNLLFATREGMPRSMVVTSSMPAEAKSSTCINLAAVLAQAGKRVLLIDADLRKPTLHQRFKLDNLQGLSNYLTHQAEVADVMQDTLIPGVSLITAGPLSPNPAELLSSERLQDLFALVPHEFDIVILDSPPVMGLADALILANRVSATVMVAAYAQSKKRALLDSFKRLKQANANIIGLVFSKVKRGGGHGYSYDYNYDYYYSYGTEKLADKSASA